MGSFEKNQKRLQQLWDEIMSDEDVTADDPYADCGSSDEFLPDDENSSNSSLEARPLKRLKNKKHLPKGRNADPKAGPSMSFKQVSVSKETVNIFKVFCFHRSAKCVIFFRMK